MLRDKQQFLILDAGSNRGIGLQLTKAFLRQSYDVFATTRPESRLNSSFRDVRSTFPTRTRHVLCSWNRAKRRCSWRKQGRPFWSSISWMRSQLLLLPERMATNHLMSSSMLEVITHPLPPAQVSSLTSSWVSHRAQSHGKTRRAPLCSRDFVL